MANMRIKEILRDRGMTIELLAKKMGINRVTLSNIINGNPTLESLEKLSNYLDVDLAELFYTTKKEKYSILKAEQNNHFTYNDENIFLNGILPHLLRRDTGYFALEIKRKDFSIIPSKDEIIYLLSSDKSIEEIVFMGNYEDKILIKLFSSYTSLTYSEYNSFCEALRLYLHFYKECKKEMESVLGTTGFQKYKEDYYLLGKIENTLWEKLLKLTKIYDLDTNKNDFEKFNYNRNQIIMYNQEIQSGYNIKMWIIPIKELSDNKEIMLAWFCPDCVHRRKVKEGLIFNILEAYHFLHQKMIPKAIKLA